ncbi:MAG: S24 family peptidase, partial [Rhodocyclaceae bacterium]|nr:S24 family peptidase [Rhodocyclaceae bacterium]
MGFPSPAADFVEERLSLDEHLIEHREATFFVRVAGHSMTGFGIHDGDLLVVDRALGQRRPWRHPCFRRSGTDDLGRGALEHPSNVTIAIVDGNNFYVSCERVFNPKLENVPVVVLERTIAELNGISCMTLEEAAPNKQQIISSRSFGAYVYDIEALGEAVASYIAIAAEKLRAQNSLAGMVQVSIRTNPHAADRPQYQRGLTIPLPEASDDTLRLTRAALWGLKRIYRPGFAYQKAGVALLNLSAAATPQLNLFSKTKDNTRLMQVMDRINGIWGRGTLHSAAEG